MLQKATIPNEINRKHFNTVLVLSEEMNQKQKHLMCEKITFQYIDTAAKC